MPTQLPVDREPADPDDVLEAVESLRSEGGILRSAQRIDTVRCIYYPAYVVEYGYQKTTGLVRKSKTTERDEFLVDAVNVGHTEDIQPYCEDAVSPVQRTVGTDPAEPSLPPLFGAPLVVEERLSEREARDYLQSKLDQIDEMMGEKREKIRERVQDLELQGRGTQAKKEAKKLDKMEGDELYDELRQLLHLPKSFTAETFAGVSHAEKVYLPFWVAQVYRDGRGDEFVAFRDTTSSLTGTVKPDTVEWMGDWFMNDVQAADLFREQ